MQMMALSRSRQAPGDILPHIPDCYRTHADKVLKHYAPDYNQAFNCLESFQTMCHTKLELRHLVIRLHQQLNHLLILVDGAYHKLLPHPKG